VVDGLELTAETAHGRRNRIGTLLVRKVDNNTPNGEQTAVDAAAERDQPERADV
jgi:hypothetical protein